MTHTHCIEQDTKSFPQFYVGRNGKRNQLKQYIAGTHTSQTKLVGMTRVGARYAHPNEEHIDQAWEVYVRTEGGIVLTFPNVLLPGMCMRLYLLHSPAKKTSYFLEISQ